MGTYHDLAADPKHSLPLLSDVATRVKQARHLQVSAEENNLNFEAAAKLITGHHSHPCVDDKF